MGDPLRVLHVVVNMNRGGAETLLMNLYRHIDRNKIQFDFLTCKKGEFDEEIIEMGGKVHRIPYVTDVGHMRFYRGLLQFLSANKEYIILHSHLDKMSGFVLYAANRAGIPIRIAHSHNTQSEGNTAAKIYKWLAGKFINANATDLIACSETAAEWLYTTKKTEALILKNGIDIGEFTFSPEVRKQMRAELQLHPSTFVLGHVGRFCAQKNHSFLIEIFAVFLKERPDSVLLLAGDGKERAVIEQKATELSVISHVKFLGARTDIERILQAIDLFVFPSLHEGMPLSVLEAQAAGLPCIISDQVTEEVDLGLDLVEQISLLQPQRWLEKMKHAERNKTVRSSRQEQIAKQGYDIIDTANLMENYYLGK
ncbi:glycosyltransferase family 1 protein [Bacillaceae bacterium Marseille-Q3522]|nr:glycosyltransferase family 1 protein [Bacillaceae bacterium Marseille-Q3522]